MKLVLLLSLLTSALAAFNAQMFTQFLLLDRYGRSGGGGGRSCRWVTPRHGGPPRKRCRTNNNNNNDDLLKLVLFSTLNSPAAAGAAAPPPPPPPPPDPTPTPGPDGCFPDAMTVERQTETGSETISIADMTLGDDIKCLKAAKGARTTAPEIGWCKFISRGHNSNESLQYDQVFFEGEEGEENMIAATSNHLIWSSRDRTLKGPVDPNKISVMNSMFVQIITVKPGDVIIVEKNGQLQYRVVTDHRQAPMSGIRNPAFVDGGLPIVNGVLATATPINFFGGHWGYYFQTLWLQDSKFTNASAALSHAVKHEYVRGQYYGTIKVGVDCLMDRVLEDQEKGVDVTALDQDSYVEAYVAPCASFPAHEGNGLVKAISIHPSA